MEANNDPIYDTEEDDWSDSEEELSSSEEEEEQEDPSSSLNNRKLIVCELHNSSIHGGTCANGHFLVYEVFSNWRSIKVNQACSIISNNYRRLARVNSPKLHHETIKNYMNIVVTNTFNELQIATCIRLPSGELVAILKTVYLRIFQRMWKKYYKKLMEKVQKRRSIAFINASRLRWPFPFK
jgi:hypothetical protein